MAGAGRSAIFSAAWDERVFRGLVAITVKPENDRKWRVSLARFWPRTDDRRPSHGRDKPVAWPRLVLNPVGIRTRHGGCSGLSLVTDQGIPDGMQSPKKPDDPIFAFLRLEARF